ncbi:MAG: hypothetical protein AAB727_03410 [Patescibacteria group bacterium]
MTLFLDFDYTLFDTVKFKGFLKENGILNDIAGFSGAAFQKDISGFLFPDTVDFLKGHDSHRLILITFGEEAFQRAKVSSSGITSYFDDMLFTGDVLKSVVLKEWFSNNDSRTPAVLLDDRMAWLYDAKRANPALIPVRMRREGAPYADEEGRDGYAEVRDLKEFARMVAAF